MAEDLLPGEYVIRDTGRLPVSLTAGTFKTINGRLILTNMRLIFKGSAFQSIVGSFLGGGREYISIPLSSITRVEKGFMATMRVHAGKTYTFKGMKGTGEWIAAIEQARLSAAGTQLQRQLPPQPPPQPVGPAKFCPNCGSQVGAGDRFCRNCGAKLTA